ncbi:amino acid ABC transporter membrane protein, PAAT family [Gottschalkia purinilytica]|uniref:Amino acid ABC transporter membrane protein, PAAT family n=1 Tax=Gottschalkia purinilytica TaxID=1503 RepID=A0A0L0W7K2_GOTPU|nr:amino acid ABC transporter permease [Gottschalkia purinilytica]KNF07528.1 amino acid ABC transporter membrane protein, PAAT family [Gottschalkia purinilytica]
MKSLDFSFIVPYLPQLIEAAGVTLKIGVLAFMLALCISLIVGALRVSNIPKVFKVFLSAYVEIFRGTPLLVQLFVIYYGLPPFGISMESYTAAIIGLALNCGAYMSEIVRASIMSVDRGQYEAAYSLGYNRISTIIYIILPQALRIAVPPFMNYFSTILKDTSLISVISIAEVTRIGNQIYARTLRPFEIYITLGVFYFVMTYLVTLLSKVLERRTSLWSQ